MNFDSIIDQVLVNEGGYTPGLADDPGGETNFGISKRSYPSLDIKGLTRPQAIEIYRVDFWQRVHGDDLPDLAALFALDFAVNCGVETSIRKLQVAAGVADDGHWGPVTQNAVKSAASLAFTLRLLAEHIDYRRRLSNFVRFGSSWDGRVANDLRFVAKGLAA